MAEKFEAFEIFVAAVLIGTPLLSAEAVIKHCRDRVHAQRVDMVLVNPEERRSHEEV